MFIWLILNLSYSANLWPARAMSTSVFKSVLACKNILHFSRQPTLAQVCSSCTDLDFKVCSWSSRPEQTTRRRQLRVGMSRVFQNPWRLRLLSGCNVYATVNMASVSAGACHSSRRTAATDASCPCVKGIEICCRRLDQRQLWIVCMWMSDKDLTFLPKAMYTTRNLTHLADAWNRLLITAMLAAKTGLHSYRELLKTICTGA